MDNVILKIHDFKCFRDAKLELRNMTILTGANASGKSSVVQALRMLRQMAFETTEGGTALVINDYHAGFELCSVSEAIQVSRREEVDSFSFELDNAKVVLREDVEYPNMAAFDIQDDKTSLEQLYPNTFLYLAAERMGPRDESKRLPYGKGDIDCGEHGDFTASIIDMNYMADADAERSFDNIDKKDKFSVQLDAWMNYVFPGISVRVINLSEKKCKVVMRNRLSGNVEISAPNIGFGITYALPILVEALLIPKGGWLVIENPEVHLHAKAQSNLGYFLGVIAAAGVRVVLETHSEHIIDGVRRAMVCRECLKPEDVIVYFMELKASNTSEISILPITIDEDGNLSDSPVDFFDQVRQDMMEIINTARARKV
ncbi:MAG: DUF3696 domain-containing protein [Paludibacteraceae bacterium]|nr:DUF3696 domain-containing protein [Paludibacteraceae bacterium]